MELQKVLWIDQSIELVMPYFLSLGEEQIVLEYLIPTLAVLYFVG